MKRKVTSEEYAKLMFPGPGLVLIRKAQLGDKYGKLFLPQEAMRRASKWCGVGYVVKKSHIRPETPYEQYLMDVYQIGDFVAFNASVPFEAPCPLDWVFENPDKKEDTTVLINVCDIAGHIVPSEEEIGALQDRWISVERDHYGS